MSAFGWESLSLVLIGIILGSVKLFFFAAKNSITRKEIYEIIGKEIQLKANAIEKDYISLNTFFRAEIKIQSDRLLNLDKRLEEILKILNKGK